MAKRPTINILANTASPTYLTQLNQNFANVQTQFDNTLSLDGSTPNAMNADIDLNGNDLINANSVNTASLRIGGENVVASAATALAIKKEFETVALLLADTGNYTNYAAGDYFRVVNGGFAYQVAASGASDHHVTTAGGVKLYVLPHDGLVSIEQFGAVVGVDATAQINAAAVAVRAVGCGLLIPQVSTFWTISGTVDLSDIKLIHGDGELRGTFSGVPAAIIGGTATTFRNADITIKTRNTPDQSTTAGTQGIRLLSLSNSRLSLFSRGFLDGIYFDGTTSNRVWVDNRIEVLELYNNGNQVNFDLAGTSYAVKNQFVGGSYFMGSSTTGSGRGTFKVTLAGSSQVADILVQSPEIGIVRNSIDISDHAMFVRADLSTSFDVSTIDFQDVRFEGYGTWAGTDAPIAVNVASQTSGRIGVSVDLSGSVADDSFYGRMRIVTPSLRINRIRLRNSAIRAQGVRSYPQTIMPDTVLPYQTANRAYVPDRVIFDSATGYNVPVDFLSSAYGSNSTSRCCSDGDVISGSTTDSFGLVYSKPVGRVSFLELHSAEQFAVVCYDASGNVLSGSAPMYAVAENGRSTTRGSVGIYEGSGRWLWLHQDVASFYIGGARWASNGNLRDIAFDVLYGGSIQRRNDYRRSPRNNVAHTSPVQAFMPLGAEMTGVASNGWRNTFYLRTATSAAAASGATTIDVATVTGITAGDTIAIELDTEIATGLRRYQYTAVSSVSGSTINLGAALGAAVAAGRTVLVNRWVTR